MGDLAKIRSDMRDLMGKLGVWSTYDVGSKRKNDTSTNKKKRKRYKVSFKKGYSTSVAQTGEKKYIRKKKRVRRKRTLRKRIAALEKFRPTLAVRKVRDRSFQQLTWGQNACAYAEIPIWYQIIKESNTNDLRFIDRTTTPAPDTIDLNDQTYSHPITFKHISLMARIRNNNELPAIVSFYWVKVNTGTSTGIVDTMNLWDASVGVTGASTNLLYYPSDFLHKSGEFKKRYTVVKSGKQTLKGGDEIYTSHHIRRHNYDPKFRDTAGGTYINGDLILLVRGEGVVGHDRMTTSLLGNVEGGVDIQYERVFDIEYQSDAAFRDMELVHNGSTMANGGEVVIAQVEDGIDGV